MKRKIIRKRYKPLPPHSWEAHPGANQGEVSKTLIIAIVTIVAIVTLSLFLFMKQPLVGEAIFVEELNAGVYFDGTSAPINQPVTIVIAANTGTKESVAVEFGLKYNSDVFTVNCENIFSELDKVFAPNGQELALIKNKDCSQPGYISLEYAALTSENYVLKNQFNLASLEFIPLPGIEIKNYEFFLDKLVVYDQYGDPFPLDVQESLFVSILDLEIEEPVSNVPELLYFEDQVVNFGELLGLEIYVDDPNGEEIDNLVAEGLPETALFVYLEDNTYRLQWTPTEEDVGEHQIVFRPCGSQGCGAQRTLIITVIGEVQEQEEPGECVSNCDFAGETGCESEVQRWKCIEKEEGCFVKSYNDCNEDSICKNGICSDDTISGESGYFMIEEVAPTINSFNTLITALQTFEDSVTVYTFLYEGNTTLVFKKEVIGGMVEGEGRVSQITVLKPEDVSKITRKEVHIYDKLPHLGWKVHGSFVEEYEE